MNHFFKIDKVYSLSGNTTEFRIKLFGQTVLTCRLHPNNKPSKLI